MRPTPLDEIAHRLETALEGSTADATELVWVETVRRWASSRRRQGAGRETRSATVSMWVEEKGRGGFVRLGEATAGELASGLRLALAQARLTPLAPRPLAPRGETVRPVDHLVDRQLVELEPAQAQQVLAHRCGKGDRAQLGWTLGTVVVVNSLGLRQAAEVTAATLEVRGRQRPGTGRAVASSRHLADLDAERVFALARERRAPLELGVSDWVPEGPVLLSPEATAALLELLTREGGDTHGRGSGAGLPEEPAAMDPLSAHLTLRDDPGASLPFPFDLRGFARRPRHLLRQGMVSSEPPEGEKPSHPAEVSSPFILPAGEPHHLVLEGGDLGADELLARAGGGLWIGWLSQVRCLDPARGRFAARARGVRKITDGALGQALPDLLWEDSVDRALSDLLGVGRELTTLATGRDDDGWLGGVSAPSLLLPGAPLRPVSGGSEMPTAELPLPRLAPSVPDAPEALPPEETPSR